MSKATIKALLWSFVTGVVVLFGTMFVLNREPKVVYKQTYCEDVYNGTDPKCPPTHDNEVLAIWTNGSSATARWNGQSWMLAVPGVSFQELPLYPVDWVELEE